MNMKKSLNVNQRQQSLKIIVNNNSNQLVHQQRVSKKQIHKNEWVRKIICETKINTSSKALSAEQLMMQINKQLSKMKVQFQLQNSLKSEYIIKNIQMEVETKKTLLYQEYYHCTLDQVSISSLPFEKRLKIFYSICRGVRDMQSQQVCHRSLNPSHICISKREQDLIAKINYFGFALKLESMKSKVSIASAEIDKFSSPELRLSKDYGLSTDIWSLGALLNYLLYETMDNIWEDCEEIKIEVPQGTSSWLFELLKSMLNYNPQKRFSIVTILDIVKVSMKCMEAMGKFTPVGSKLLKLNRKQTKMENCNSAERQQ